MTKTASRFAPELSAQDAHPPRCVVCGYSGAGESFAAAEPGFAVWTCPDCGLGRTLPAPSAAEIAKWYPESYYGKENVRFNPVFESLTRLFQRRRAAVIFNRVPRGPVLDVGCGRGWLLYFLREAGYEPHGLEFSDTAAWHARNRLGLEVLTCDFLEGPHQRDRFNAVVFWHVLEHLPKPSETLARTRELLRPGGLVAVAVPNYESLQARLFGRHWFHLDVPRHYFHLGPRTLEALLTRHGFRIVQADHFCFEQNPFGWLQSFYNLFGFSHNLLYTLLKSSSARTTRALEHPVQTLLILALLPALLPLSFGLTLLEAALRRGGTIEVYALKEG